MLLAYIREVTFEMHLTDINFNPHGMAVEDSSLFVLVNALYRHTTESGA
jgi:hypothetical protein